MTAFDTAWSLLKMPIVPHSLREEEGGFNADFEDPTTKEIMSMRATHNGGLGNMDDTDLMRVEMRPSDPEKDTFDPKGRLIVRDDPISIFHTGENREKGKSFWPHHSYVDPPLRRRGYATGMYNMIAAILDRYKGKGLTPSNSLSDEAHALWDSESGPGFGYGKRNKPWPVRDDLWRDDP